MTRFRIPPAALLAAIGLLAAALPASAAVTTTNVTTPAGPDVFRTVDTSNGADPQITIAGTAPGAGGGDLVDLRCYRFNTSGNLVFANVKTNVAAGSGSFNVTTSDEELRSRRCLLRAVPAGSSPASLTNFSGPTVFTAQVVYERVSGGPNDGKLRDWHVDSPQRRAYNDIYEYVACSLCDSSLYTGPNSQESEYLWYYNLAPNTDTNYPPMFNGGVTASGMLVDGKWGYDAYWANDTGSENSPGFPAVDVKIGIGADNALNITETVPIVTCLEEPTTYPPVGGCSQFSPSAIQEVRTYQTLADGREVLAADHYTSADGAAHNLKLVYWQSQDSTAPFGLMLPWSSPSFFTPTQSQVFPPPPGAPYAIYAKNKIDSPDGSLQYPTGAIISDSPPSDMRASDEANSSNVLEFRDRTVPASGELKQQFAFVLSENRADVDAGVAKYTNLFSPPAVKITKPTNGSTVKTNSPIAVEGTASDAQGAVSVKVNGKSATVANGKWSTTLDVKKGSNTIEAIATDTAGVTSSDKVTFTYGDKTKPKVKTSITSRSRHAIKGRLTSDENATAALTVTGKATAAKRLGKKKVKLVANKRKSFKVKLKHARRGKVTLTIKVKDTAGNTKTVRKKIKLR